MSLKLHTLALSITALASAQGATTASPNAPGERVLHNETAYIPPQCYTKTRDAAGDVHNPCYVCHTESRRPNFINDGDLQLAYSLPHPATDNPWTNLFRDRSDAIAQVSDDEMLAYLREDNYTDAVGRIIPADRLFQPLAAWDFNGDGHWQGFIPDAVFDFDDEGFDHDRDGVHTGWRAFAYHPFPGTFWPTNGSTGDVLIRLPAVFRKATDGHDDLAVYKINLAIVEAMVREADVPIAPTDETTLGGTDLDKDGRIGTASIVRYDWAPLKGRHMTYVGAAAQAQRQGRIHLAAGLYPEGTEFLHTVRYIDPMADGRPRLSARIKEVRYARKDQWLNYGLLEARAAKEAKEKSDFPDRSRFIRGNIEHGVRNGQGWTYAGLIEDANGALRPQSFEELAHCVGCHGGIGATTDSSFALPRKLPAGTFRDGWYHWSQQAETLIADRVREDGKGEYALYLEENGAGDEFRSNDEVRARFFDVTSTPRADALSRLQTDIGTLLEPSRERALQLNKAYLSIVREQSFDRGRIPTMQPLETVYRRVDDRDVTGVAEPVRGR